MREPPAPSRLSDVTKLELALKFLGLGQILRNRARGFTADVIILFRLFTYIKTHLCQEEIELLFPNDTPGHEDQGQNGSEKT
jgi:hypothetical protein